MTGTARWKGGREFDAFAGKVGSNVPPVFWQAQKDCIQRNPLGTCPTTRVVSSAGTRGVI